MILRVGRPRSFSGREDRPLMPVSSPRTRRALGETTRCTRLTRSSASSNWSIVVAKMEPLAPVMANATATVVDDVAGSIRPDYPLKFWVIRGDICHRLRFTSFMGLEHPIKVRKLQGSARESPCVRGGARRSGKRPAFFVLLGLLAFLAGAGFWGPAAP